MWHLVPGCDKAVLGGGLDSMLPELLSILIDSGIHVMGHFSQSWQQPSCL